MFKFITTYLLLILLVSCFISLLFSGITGAVKAKVGIEYCVKTQKCRLF